MKENVAEYRGEGRALCNTLFVCGKATAVIPEREFIGEHDRGGKSKEGQKFIIIDMLGKLSNHRGAGDVVEEARDVRAREPELTRVKGVLDFAKTVRHAAIRYTADTRWHFEHLPDVAALVLQAIEERALDDPVVHAGHYDPALTAAAALLFEHAPLWVKLEPAAVQLRLQSADVTVDVLIEVGDLRAGVEGRRRLAVLADT